MHREQHREAGVRAPLSAPTNPACSLGSQEERKQPHYQDPPYAIEPVAHGGQLGSVGRAAFSWRGGLSSLRRPHFKGQLRGCSEASTSLVLCC